MNRLDRYERVLTVNVGSDAYEVYRDVRENYLVQVNGEDVEIDIGELQATHEFHDVERQPPMLLAYAMGKVKERRARKRRQLEEPPRRREPRIDVSVELGNAYAQGYRRGIESGIKSERERWE